jgi:hypothetical protein
LHGGYVTLVARGTLERARFFVRKARETPLEQREDHATYLEAAVVFSRSVTFHLQKELSGHPAFAEWYQAWQGRLSQTPVSRYLLEQRNYVLKEGPLKTRRIISVTATASVRARAHASVQVIRGAPWYRRPLKILVEDALRPFREWMRRRAEQRREEEEEREAREKATAEAVTRDAMYFDDEEWANTPALDLVEQNLTLLDDLVADAETRFSQGSGNAT